MGAEDTAHPRNQGEGGGSHEDQRIRTRPGLRARGFLRCSRVKRTQSQVPALSDHRDKTEPKQRLCSRKTRTELSALSHLPLRVGTRASCTFTLSQTETQDVVLNSEPSSRLSQPETCAGFCSWMRGHVESSGEVGEQGKLVTESTVTWRGIRDTV